MLYDMDIGQEETIRRIVSPGEQANVTLRVYLISDSNTTRDIKLHPRWIPNTLHPGYLKFPDENHLNSGKRIQI